MPDTRIQEQEQERSADRPCGICGMRAEATSESVVYADAEWTALTALDVPGWIMVVANRHSGDWLWGLTPGEAGTLGPVIQRIGAAAKAELATERVYLMGFGEQWQHFHFVLLSRSATVPAELRGAGLFAQAAQLANPAEAAWTAARIRERLAVQAQ